VVVAVVRICDGGFGGSDSWWLAVGRWWVVIGGW
jgi:hypothetical protein